MTTTPTANGAASELFGEIRRYLIAVDAFRAEGREPLWLPEERGWTEVGDLREPRTRRSERRKYA